jgi:hypothetical protein
MALAFALPPLFIHWRDRYGALEYLAALLLGRSTGWLLLSVSGGWLRTPLVEQTGRKLTRRSV